MPNVAVVDLVMGVLVDKADKVALDNKVYNWSKITWILYVIIKLQSHAMANCHIFSELKNLPYDIENYGDHTREQTLATNSMVSYGT